MYRQVSKSGSTRDDIGSFVSGCSHRNRGDDKSGYEGPDSLRLKVIQIPSITYERDEDGNFEIGKTIYTWNMQAADGRPVFSCVTNPSCGRTTKNRIRSGSDHEHFGSIEFSARDTEERT